MIVDLDKKKSSFEIVGFLFCLRMFKDHNHGKSLIVRGLGRMTDTHRYERKPRETDDEQSDQLYVYMYVVPQWLMYVGDETCIINLKSHHFILQKISPNK